MNEKEHDLFCSHEYDLLYSKVRKAVEHLLFEPKSGTLPINDFPRLKEQAGVGHGEISPDAFHELLCEIYGDLLREGLIVIDPVRGFHVFSISSRCLRRYRKRHVRPRQSAHGF